MEWIGLEGSVKINSFQAPAVGTSHFLELLLMGYTLSLRSSETMSWTKNTCLGKKN